MSIVLASDEKIAETSSKGNQEKWFEPESNRWYKADQFGYEALSETFTSQLLEESNIETEYPFHFVRYRMERLKIHGRERVGCSSENFLRPGESIITLSHLFKRELGEPLSATLKRLPSDKRRITYLSEKTAELTGLERFPEYLTLLFEVDALVLNEDRHLNNIAVLRKEDGYDYCPVFDNGAALLSNTQIYRLDVEPKAHIPLTRARPFNTTFNRQLSAVQTLTGPKLTILRFTEKELRERLLPLLAYYPFRDQDLIADRVCACIMARQKKVLDSRMWVDT